MTNDGYGQYFEKQAQTYVDYVFDSAQKDLYDDIFLHTYQKLLERSYKFLQNFYVPKFTPIKYKNLEIDVTSISGLPGRSLDYRHRTGYFSLYPYIDYMLEGSMKYDQGKHLFVLVDEENPNIDGHLVHQIPVLKIDDKVWMSTSPLELESQMFGVQAAHGTTVIGGLGMGLAYLNILRNPEVTKVIVYETNEDVLELFMRSCYPNLPSDMQEKVDNTFFRVQDILHNPLHEDVDFVYFDIWPILGDDRVVPDLKQFGATNCKRRIGALYWWGMEYDYLEFTKKSEETFSKDISNPVYLEMFMKMRDIAVTRWFQMLWSGSGDVLAKIKLDPKDFSDREKRVLFISSIPCFHTFNLYMQASMQHPETSLVVNGWNAKYKDGKDVPEMLSSYLQMTSLWIVTAAIYMEYDMGKIKDLCEQIQEGLN